MNMSAALTVILIAGNNRQRAQRMLRSVLDQDVADQVVVIVYDRADRPTRDLPEFTLPNIVYEPVEKHSTYAQLQKRGLLAASTEVVAFIEEHVVVPPGWARESLERHREGYAGVSGTFVSGNPQRRWARTVLLITYGSYAVSAQPGETINIPGDNSSFIRSKLLKYGEELETLLSTDILLTRRLIADGERLYRADMVVRHWNDVKFVDNWLALFYSNQLYICNLMAVEKWSLGQRLRRLLVIPLVPFVRLLKNYRAAKQNRVEMKQLLADIPAIFLFHVASAAGMAAALLFGYQNSERRFADYETTAESWE